MTQMWIGFPVTAIPASLTASECVGWAWQANTVSALTIA
jgi:hypothetical protein